MLSLVCILQPYCCHLSHNTTITIDESDILAVATPMSYFAPGMMNLSIQIEAIDDQITEDVEVFDVIVEAVNPLDSVSSQNSSTVNILDNDGNKT